MKKKLTIKIAIYISMAVTVTAIVMAFPLHRYEANLYDFLYQIRGSQSPSKEIVLLGIDDKTVKDLKKDWPLPLNYHVDVLKHILDQNPKVIAYINQFREDTANYTNSSQKRFKEIALKNADKLMFPSKLSKLDTAKPHASFIPSTEVFQNGIATSSISGAQDGVSRRHVVRLSKIHSFESAIAKKLGYIKSFSDLPSIVYTNYLGPKNTFKHISFSDVINNKLPVDYFKDKIVLIGRTTSDYAYNFETTPTDKKLYSFTKLEIHATVVNNIITNTYLTKADSNILAPITFIASLVSIILTMEIAPILGLLSLIITIGLFYGLSFISLVYNNMWLQSFHPLLVIFISYYILIPYRLLKETRKRVAMEKEHEALSKVEKFKTNFISLMSHDLKTPIASIHGTAEVLSHENSGLNEKLRKSIKSNIVKRSEDLLKFVNSILDVAKVESENISLNMESKDINNIIEKCVADLSYLAKTKDIEIRAELEPLFPIKVDVSLMRQVISTLIENAIKYSPDGSRITLKSSDYNDTFLEIKVSDNGPGIPKKERDLIFTKFYRGNSSRTNPIKGTGLGLYLAKYFVELHKGKIAISSAKAGSTFSVLLPLS